MNAHAVLAPGYDNLSKIDLAIAALAKGGKSGLAVKNAGDVTVASVRMSQNKTTGSDIINVDVGNLNCSVILTINPPAKNSFPGPISRTAKITACNRYESFAKVEVMKYDDARPTLADAASKGQTNLSFRVVGSAQGPKVELATK